MQLHVEAYYHRRPIQVDMETLTETITDLGFGTASEQLASLSVSPATRYQALQHMISRVVFGRTVFSPESRPSMLGPAIAK